MKKTVVIIIVIIIVFFSLYYFGATKDNIKFQETNSNIENSDNEINDSERIYEDDEGINLFLNKYNELNTDKITKEMIKKAHIGGSDRDNVVTILNDKLEINIYDNYKSINQYNISVYVGYKTKIEATLDDYKEQFIKYIKLFDENLSNEDINNYWNEMISTYNSNYDIKDIDIITSTNNGTISYFKLTKNLKL